MSGRQFPLLVMSTIAMVALSSGCDGDKTNSPALAGRQAQDVRLVEEFIAAFNAADLAGALGLFAADSALTGEIGVSDCEYRRAKSLRFIGRPEVRRWLEQRFADNDQLTVRNLRPVDGGVVADYKRRTSNTLKALGFSDGIQPGGASKVATTRSGAVRMTQFANAGNDAACRRGGLAGFRRASR
jgi:hypothetical protein